MKTYGSRLVAIRALQAYLARAWKKASGRACTKPDQNRGSGVFFMSLILRPAGD